MEEFFRQGDMEQELGLDFSPLCDRTNTVVPQSQIGKYVTNQSREYSQSSGFIDFIVYPVFGMVGDIINLVLDKEGDQANKPWENSFRENKDIWQVKVS